MRSQVIHIYLCIYTRIVHTYVLYNTLYIHIVTDTDTYLKCSKPHQSWSYQLVEASGDSSTKFIHGIFPRIRDDPGPLGSTKVVGCKWKASIVHRQISGLVTCKHRPIPLNLRNCKLNAEGFERQQGDDLRWKTLDLRNWCRGGLEARL